MYKSSYVKLMAICAILVAATGTGFAQVGWLNPEGRPGVQIEASSGSFDKHKYSDAIGRRYVRGFDFPTGFFFASARANLGHGAHLVTELPLFNTEYNGMSSRGLSSSTKLGVGNPYLGIEVAARPGTSPLLAFGLRLPFVRSKDTTWVAPAYLFESHRSAAYLERTSTLYVNSGYRYIDPSGSGYRITVGSQLAIRALGHEELFGDLSTSFWYRTGSIRLTGLFGGLVRLTEPNVGGDRLRLNVGMAADVDLGEFQPGVHVRIPVDNNVTNGINPTFGLHMAYLFLSSPK